MSLHSPSPSGQWYPQSQPPWSAVSNTSLTPGLVNDQAHLLNTTTTSLAALQQQLQQQQVGSAQAAALLASQTGKPMMQPITVLTTTPPQSPQSAGMANGPTAAPALVLPSATPGMMMNGNVAMPPFQDTGACCCAGGGGGGCCGEPPMPGVPGGCCGPPDPTSSCCRLPGEPLDPYCCAAPGRPGCTECIYCCCDWTFLLQLLFCISTAVGLGLIVGLKSMDNIFKRFGVRSTQQLQAAIAPYFILPNGQDTNSCVHHRQLLGSFGIVCMEGNLNANVMVTQISSWINARDTLWFIAVVYSAFSIIYAIMVNAQRKKITQMKEQVPGLPPERLAELMQLCPAAQQAYLEDYMRVMLYCQPAPVAQNVNAALSTSSEGCGGGNNKRRVLLGQQRGCCGSTCCPIDVYGTPFYEFMRFAWLLVGFTVFVWTCNVMLSFWAFSSFYRNHTTGPLNRFWTVFSRKFTATMIVITIFLAWPFCCFFVELVVWVVLLVPWVIIRVTCKAGIGYYRPSLPPHQLPGCIRADMFFMDFQDIRRLGYSWLSWKILTGSELPFCSCCEDTAVDRDPAMRTLMRQRELWEQQMNALRGLWSAACRPVGQAEAAAMNATTTVDAAGNVVMSPSGPMMILPPTPYGMMSAATSTTAGGGNAPGIGLQPSIYNLPAPGPGGIYANASATNPAIAAAAAAAQAAQANGLPPPGTSAAASAAEYALASTASLVPQATSAGAVAPDSPREKGHSRSRRHHHHNNNNNDESQQEQSQPHRHGEEADRGESREHHRRRSTRHRPSSPNRHGHEGSPAEKPVVTTTTTTTVAAAPPGAPLPPPPPPQALVPVPPPGAAVPLVPPPNAESRHRHRGSRSARRATRDEGGASVSPRSGEADNAGSRGRRQSHARRHSRSSPRHGSLAANNNNNGGGSASRHRHRHGGSRSREPRPSAGAMQSPSAELDALMNL